MKLPRFTKKTGGVSMRLLLLGIALAFVPLVLMAQAPTWWSQRGVTNNNSGNDYAAVNQGQVKNITVKAIAEFDADLPGGAGDILHTLATKLSGTTANTNDYAAVNLGQLKNLSKPLFDRLLQAGYQGHPLESGTYPWAGKESSSNDYAMANIGQVKNLFSFDLTSKTDPNNPLPDWWQMHWFGQLGIDPSADSDGDGVSNYEEFQHGTNPASAAMDTNGLPFDWETAHAGTFAAWPPLLSATISINQTAPGAILLRNDTSASVNYTATVTGNIVDGGTNYSFQDSVSGTTAYSWEEISTTGTLISDLSGADDASSQVNFTSFTFPFYGNSYSSVYVCSNGYLTFGNGDTNCYNSSLPSPSAPVNMIAPFWDDLIISSPGAIYYKEESDRFIIQYQNVSHYGGGGTYTFQVVLYSNGRIEFRYKSVSGSTDSCTVGIQDATGSTGLQMVCNAPYITGSMAVAISSQVEFYTIGTLSGTAAPHSVASLSGTFHSLTLPFGTYTANVSIAHNGAGTSPQNVSARLNVVNLPSQVAIISPTNGYAQMAGVPLDLVATATDPDTIVQHVEFYDGTMKIGDAVSGTANQYTLTWNGLTAGSHSITAKAIDNFGQATSSSPITVVGTQGPITIISPVTGYSQLEAQPVNLVAYDPDITIQRVEFYDGTTKIGDAVSGTANQYTLKWTGLTAGSHSITAKAIYAQASAVTSSSITVTGIQDSDHDGMPDAWEIANGLNPSDPSDANADSDGDGISNYEAYTLGISPFAAALDFQVFTPLNKNP